jgi:ADP-heptose:LPS heptosyltransferase
MRLRVRENILYWLLRLVKKWDRRKPAFNATVVKRILLVSCTAIGDTLMSTPAFRSMRKAYPDARIDLLLNPAHLDLFKNNPSIDRFFTYNGKWRTFIATTLQLRKQHYDVVAILHGNDPQVTPMAYLSGAQWIFRLPNTTRFRFLLTNTSPILRWEDFSHGIEQRLAVAQLAGGAEVDWTMTLDVAKGADEAIDQFLQAQNIDPKAKLFCFQVGASSRRRHWPVENYIEVGKVLLARYPEYFLVITGSPQEKPLADTVAQGIGHPHVLVTAGQIPLAVLPALVHRCKFVITPDTGIMHMAVALKTPVLALFAVSSWQVSGPRQDMALHYIIQKARTSNESMAQISIEEVLAGAAHLIEKGVP